MRKVLLGCLMLIASLSAFAAEGDTTHLRVHDAVHMNWYGNFDSIAQFPTTNTSYRKILMKYTIGCPSSGCSEWDYTTQIKMREIDQNDTFWVELGRLITPYAGNFSNSWTQEHWFDITDFAPVLTGDKLLRAHYSGYQDGFTVTLDFYFIEGTPPRDPKRVIKLYDGSFKYGQSSDPIEDHLTAYNFTLDQDESQVALHYTPTGHSFGGNENCAEFCPKNYYVKFNGNTIATQLIWNDECGSNPLYPQAGTWLYERSNWCPGSKAKRYQHDLISPVSGQNTVDVDMQSFTHSGTNNPVYIVYGALVTYGDWNYQNDAEILEILAPNNDFEYNRMNPICASPKIKFRNSGANTLTSVKFHYSVPGGEVYSYTWTGSLEPLEETEVEFDQNPYFLYGKTDNVFTVSIQEVNGSADEYDQNNTLSVAFDETEQVPEEFVVWWKSNGSPTETSWRIETPNGFVMAQSGTTSANESHKDTINLPEGCYRFILEDDACDGLYFFANNDGSGYVRLHKVTNDLIHGFEQDFGCGVDYNFTVGYVVGDSTSNDNGSGDISGTGDIYLEKSQFKLYPNPSENVLNVDLFLNNTVNKGTMYVTIYDLSGAVVKTTTLGANTNGTTQVMNIEDLAPGMYLFNLTGDQYNATQRFVKQ
ncbi:MAG: hypothetical protein CL843_15480 [Crocinitomicaceae bacterium]|nr:hypothetical protein [Crocinitomicaceae bacterium]|tara:strand:- start:4010 stop:5950 length:1941 start_codon:yes stop_codon:yes gene_type:complete